MPYLIAMSTDSEQTVKVKADQQLSDHSSRYGHFMQVHNTQVSLLDISKSAVDFTLDLSTLL